MAVAVVIEIWVIYKLTRKIFIDTDREEGWENHQNFLQQKKSPLMENS